MSGSVVVSSSFKGFDLLGGGADFWSRVDRSRGPDACWPFLGRVDRDGYGRVRNGTATVGAHRVALELASKRPVRDGYVVMHACDNPTCCNPRHLREASQADNLLDMRVKGRSNPTRTHCLRGHLLDAATRRPDGHGCRICVEARSHARWGTGPALDPRPSRAPRRVGGGCIRAGHDWSDPRNFYVRKDGRRYCAVCTRERTVRLPATPTGEVDPRLRQSWPTARRQPPGEVAR